MSKLLPVSLAIAVSALTLASVALRRVEAAQTDKASAPTTMAIPADYREWIFLTSGIDMTYTQPGAVGLTAEHGSTFDNVFVNPDAYRTFMKTGLWPDKTTFVLENRSGEHAVSINKAGQTQGDAITGLEIHAKVNNEWAFYVRGKDGKEHLIPKPASCYTCHESHAAVDTTFVQFYPTLLPLAKEKKLLSESYLKDEAANTAPPATAK